MQAAARIIGQQLLILDASKTSKAPSRPLFNAGSMHYLSGRPFLASYREQVVMLAARHTLPTSYPLRAFAAKGGLMSYGASVTDAYRQVSIYTDESLKVKERVTCRRRAPPNSN